MSGKRKSYKASSRRHKRRADGTEELGDLSDDEDGESLERKMARLRREIEELKDEAGKRKMERQKAGQEVVQDEGTQVSPDDAAVLSRLLDGISLNNGTTGSTASTRLARALASSLPASAPPSQTTAPPKSGEPATYTVTYAPNYLESHVLAKAADFDGRLTALEKALGIPSTSVPAFSTNGSPLAILPTLDTLQRQISVLSTSTPTSLDAVSRRVRTLTQEAERLKDERRAAKIAQDELRAIGGEAGAKGTADGEDSEQAAKINALYGTLPTIENLAPLLPSLLERLRSLRTIHADAAQAGEGLEKLALRQEEMGREIARWREGLVKVEAAIKESEGTVGGNMKAVEGWVKELEGRVQSLAG